MGAEAIGIESEETTRQGEEDGGWAINLAGRPTVWQGIIHGASAGLRRRYAEWLVERGSIKRAGTYAMCGMGDEIVEGVEGTYRVKPRRCGNRFCPRCSRYSGLHFVRQVTQHLRAGPHGSIHHVVLTQVVRPRETLIASRERFEVKWVRWWTWLQSLGFLSGLRTTHITWSRHGGWHVHAHVVVEFDPVVEDGSERLAGLVGRWRDKVTAEGHGIAADMFQRDVCGAGVAMGLEEEDQGEFWHESTNEAERVVQYCVRDVCQGVESWSLEEAGPRVSELFSGVGCAKLHRLLGQWRRSVKERFGFEPEEKVAVEVSAEECNIIGGDLSLGTVDSVYYRAMNGEVVAKEVLGWLVRSLSNMSLMSRRLMEVFSVVAS